MGTETEFADPQLPDLPGVPTEMEYLETQWQGPVDVIGAGEGETFTVDVLSSLVEREDLKLKIVHSSNPC